MAPSKRREKEQPMEIIVSPTDSMTSANDLSNGNSINKGDNVTPEKCSPITSVNAENLRLNNHQQEQELFLQAFEKPTQIYRYLRNRHESNPIFLYRNLTYMKNRMSRNNKKRQNFKVDNMLSLAEQKSNVVTHSYLHVIFDALFQKCNDYGDSMWQEGQQLVVETSLYKITRSKRKDSTLDFQEILNKTSEIVCNPKIKPEQHSIITIPVQKLLPMGEQHTLYKLIFRIKSLKECAAALVEQEATPKKRVAEKMYGCELILYDKLSGFLSEGEYEASLQPLSSLNVKSFSPKKCTWDGIPENYISRALGFDMYQHMPILKFYLILSDKEFPKLIHGAELCRYAPCIKTDTLENQDSSSLEINHNNNSITNGCVSANVPNRISPEHNQLVYNFMYSNNTRQQTEYTRELNCPWCGLNCLVLISLLKHLQMCHARFNFTYGSAGKDANIEVTINDGYDGSYAGSPYDMAGPSGNSFARTSGPVRRTSVTFFLVCHPRRPKLTLDEFRKVDEDDITSNRSYATGHNRLYHHTATCLPVNPKDLDVDSEGESDPLWLRQKTIQMIDEFSDVNEGEKELMKLWNLHIMKHGFVGDCQLPLACDMFLVANGHEIIHKNLYRNFILHMSSLFDYGLIGPDTVYHCIQKLQGILSKYTEGQEIMSKHREAQLKYWLDVGIHKQDEQKLKSPLKKLSINKTDILGPLDNNTNGSSSTSSSSSMPITSTACAARIGKREKKTMQPPKRMPNAIKRSPNTISSISGNQQVEKFALGKNVAKKTVDQLSVSAQATVANRERRSDNVIKRNMATETLNERNSRSPMKPTLKRKLTTTDMSTSTIASKRRSLDIRIQNNTSTATRNNSTSSAVRNVSSRSIVQLSKSQRLIARSQSTIDNISAAYKNRDKSNKATHHGLRKRLSATSPLNKNNSSSNRR